MVIFEEFPAETNEATKADNTAEAVSGEEKTEWKIVAQIDGAHGVYEVNDACWAKRWDKGKRSEGEEMVVTTGDDGIVQFWEINE